MSAVIFAEIIQFDKQFRQTTVSPVVICAIFKHFTVVMVRFHFGQQHDMTCDCDAAASGVI